MVAQRGTVGCEEIMRRLCSMSIGYMDDVYRCRWVKDGSFGARSSLSVEDGGLIYGGEVCICSSRFEQAKSNRGRLTSEGAMMDQEERAGEAVGKRLQKDALDDLIHPRSLLSQKVFA
jgi:hypothetical protein